MIRGSLLEPVNSQGQPISVAIPYMVATLKIPRLNALSSITFLLDTGADFTSLQLRDVFQILGLSGLKKLRGNRNAIGIGGSAPYSIEPAEIIFSHEDNTIEGYTFNLSIAKPITSWWLPRQIKLQALQLRIPSILGRDILCQFRLVIDYHCKEILLDHPQVPIKPPS